MFLIVALEKWSDVLCVCVPVCVCVCVRVYVCAYSHLYGLFSVHRVQGVKGSLACLTLQS